MGRPGAVQDAAGSGAVCLELRRLRKVMDCFIERKCTLLQQNKAKSRKKNINLPYLTKHIPVLPISSYSL